MLSEYLGGEFTRYSLPLWLIFFLLFQDVTRGYFRTTYIATLAILQLGKPRARIGARQVAAVAKSKSKEKNGTKI